METYDIDKPTFNCKECGIQVNPNLWGNKVKLIEKQVCFSCWHWLDIIESIDSPFMVIIKGEAYCIVDEDSKSGMRGFGGRPFVIDFINDTHIKTTNLWYMGSVPKRFTDRLPDNAKSLRCPTTDDEWQSYPTKRQLCKLLDS